MGKLTTNNMLALDVRRLPRKELLHEGAVITARWGGGSSINIAVGCGFVTLRYAEKGEYHEQQVCFSYSDCHLGGERMWFICPHCNKRVAILYAGKRFLCRHCYRLAYQSQREDWGGRATLRADAIRRKLGWKPGIANPEGYKPKGMHWRTFYRLRDEYRHHASTANDSLVIWMGKRFGLKV